ncbi:MAG: hypothetical protein ABWK05_05690 [Pyrobaculum sp.]
MRRVALLAAFAALMLINPLVGALAAALYITRRHLHLYLLLWARLLKCEKLTVLTAIGAAAAASAYPHAGVDKFLLLTLGAFSLYAAPISTRFSRFLSVATVLLALPPPLKPALLAPGLALAYLYAFRLSTCGYVCQKWNPLEVAGDVGFVPDLGVVCFYEKGGGEFRKILLRVGGAYARCDLLLCRVLRKEDFAVGFAEYLPPATGEEFREVVATTASLDKLLQLLRKLYQTVVVTIDADGVYKTRLVSLLKADPGVVKTVFEELFKLDAEKSSIVEKLLRRGSIEEIKTWSLRHPWLAPLAELAADGESPAGVVKSSAPGKLGVAESVIYAFIKKAPVVTDSKDVALLASRLGLTVFMLNSPAGQSLLVIGPASLKTPYGEVVVGSGKYVAHIDGVWYGGEA